MSKEKSARIINRMADFADWLFSRMEMERIPRMQILAFFSNHPSCESETSEMAEQFKKDYDAEFGEAEEYENE